MAKYRHTHVVTKSYLGEFADDNHLVNCWFVAEGTSKPISIVDAAVRSNFYIYRGPDGTRRTDVEEAFGPLEGEAIMVIREIDDRWPLSDTDHALLTEFVSLHFVRGPAWRQFHDATRDRVLAETVHEGLPHEVLQGHVAGVSSDRYRLNLMLRQIPLVGTLFGGMHWQLVRFGENRLITADHPVVCLPFSNLVGVEAVPSYGLRNIVEVRMALTPSRAIVLTWLDEPNDLPPMRGHPHLARQLNHSTRLQAEKQWFSRPGSSPAVRDADLHHVGPKIHQAAGVLDGLSSRWRDATAAAQRMADAQGARQSMSIVRIRRAA